MKKSITRDIALLGLATALFSQNPAAADVLPSTLEAPAAPTAAGSAMYSMDAVYDRLHDGTAGEKRGGAFDEPSAGPADGVGKTLDEIMAVAPAADNVNGATPADVVAGKTYWSLRTDSTWGLQTGTLAAGTASVPKTGQTTTYAANDDGALHKGAAWPNPRFTDNNDGTVTDNLTGLIWLKNANCTTVSPKTWSLALTAVGSLHTGDCSLTDNSAPGDWRLPNKKELFSLVSEQYFSPALSNTSGTAKWTPGTPPFTSVVLTLTSNYWSSTTYIPETTKAWVVNFYDGSMYYNLKASSSYYVWPVRGGQ